MKNKTNESIIDNDALLSRKEAMELIKCSHSTLYRYQKEGAFQKGGFIGGY